MRSRNLWQIVILLWSLTACRPQPSAQASAKELETVASWAATVHMVGDAWLRDAVPSVYAKQTLQTAQEELNTEAPKVAKVALEQDRTKILEQLQSLAQTVDGIKKAVEQDERTTLTQHLQQLSTQEKAIAQSIEMAGGEP